MTMKRDAAKRQTEKKKLTLKKETIRDLTTRKGTSGLVRGGANTLRRCL